MRAYMVTHSAHQHASLCGPMASPSVPLGGLAREIMVQVACREGQYASLHVLASVLPGGPA